MTENIRTRNRKLENIDNNINQRNSEIKDEKNEDEIKNLYEQSKLEFQNSLNIDEPKITFFKVPFILLACCLVSYFIGYFNISIVFLFFVMYSVFFVFSRSIKKFKRSMAAIVFKSERNRQIPNLESVEWINFAIQRFWNIIEGEISKEVFRIVNPILREKCPSFLSGLSLSEFTLGSLPPVIKGISFDHRREKNIISFDCELYFAPLETGKGPAAVLLEESVNWNSRIVITARLGLALKGRGFNVPILVQNLFFYGNARINLQLSRNLKSPLKSVEFCFLSQPNIDFDLSPLKAIDLMNTPGLSSFIHNLIDSNISKQLVDPNTIKIDLEKKSVEKVIPHCVAMLHIYSMFNKTDESIIGEIDIDGRRIYKTIQREGTQMVFNEYFYIILNKNDQMLNIVFRSKNIQNEHKYGTAGICLKKLRGIGSLLQSTKIWKKGVTRSVIDTDLKLYPIITGPLQPNKHIAAQAIFILNVQYIENLQAKGKSRNRFYNIFVQVTVCKKITEKITQRPGDFLTMALEKSGNITKKLTGTITKNLKKGFNTIVGLDNDDADLLMDASSSTFFLGRTKMIMETKSPIFEEKFEIFSRDIQKDMIYLNIIDQQESENEIIGRVELPLRDIYDGTEKEYKINNAQSGKIKLSFDLHYITPFISPFKPYKNAIRLRFEELITSYDEGVFYVVVRNQKESFFLDTFCYGDLPINREIIVPAEMDEEFFRIYLFRENTYESEFLGDGKLYLNEEKEPNITNTQKVELKYKDDLVATFSIEIDSEPLKGIGCQECDEEISMNSKIETTKFNGPISNDECVIHKKDLTDINPCESSASTHFHETQPQKLIENDSSRMFHVVQVCFKHFEGIKNDFFIEFVSGGEIIKKSGLVKPQSKSEIGSKTVLGQYEKCRLNSNCEVFTLLCGQTPVYARLRTASFGKQDIFAETVITKRCFNGKIELSNSVTAQLTVCSQKAAFKWKDFFKIGFLEVRILNAIKIRAVEDDGTSDPFVKVYLNNKKAYKTKTIHKTLNPVYNENFYSKVNIMTDILRFEIIDWNRIESNQMISFIEIPLYFLTEGFTDVNLHLIDAVKMRKSDSVLHLGFNFNKNLKSGVDQKKVLKSEFIN